MRVTVLPALPVKTETTPPPLRLGSKLPSLAASPIKGEGMARADFCPKPEQLATSAV
jgi:hypothetical protein